MKYRKLDANGDYTLGTGQDFYANTPEAVAQAVKTRLSLIEGEWFLDDTAGFPWRKYVIGKLPSNAYDALIQAYVLETAHVKDIVEYSSSLDRNTRALTVNVTITTDYGQATVGTVL